MSISPRLVNLVTAWALKVTGELQEGMEEATGHGPPEQAALVLLANRPGENIEFLRTRLAMSHPGCVRLVDRLAAEGMLERRPSSDPRPAPPPRPPAGGMLERRPSSDARAVALHLTAAGRRTAKVIHRRRDRVVTQALAGIG